MKKVAIVLTICMVLSILGGGVVFAKGGPPTGAGAAKMPLYNSTGEKDVGYDCEDGCLQFSDGPYGFVILNTNASGDLIVEVALKGATPNAEYIIYVNQVDVDWSVDCPIIRPQTIIGDDEDGLSTNGKGNGNLHVETARYSAADKFWVSAMEKPLFTGQCLRSVAVVLD